ncbi:excinuclease ABC subunit UvrC [Patescibacteria group bacterium]
MKTSKKILKILENIPKKPGVYQFKDESGEILYIGKAIDLRKRVKNYFQQTDKQSVRIQKMISQINDIDYTIVSSDLEAIILETNLIKEIRPKYNILMKDDKNFVYIKITKNEDFPQISIVRKVLNDGALYFGPKTAANKVRKTLDVLKKIFPYRHCNLFMEYHKGKVVVTKKTTKYPCLDFHIKRCIGPCVGNCSKEEYDAIIKQIIHFLQGKADEILEMLSKEMQQAALDKKFEKAAKLRDKLHAVQEIIEKQVISAPHREDIDAVNYSEDSGRVFFTLFMIRDGKLINQENFVFKSGEDDEKIDDTNEILESFLKQYYEKTTDFPKEILIPHEIVNAELMAKWITSLKGKKVSLMIPQKGEKHKILDLTLRNAKTYANLSRVKWQNNEVKRKKALEELKEKLKLPKIPRRIECYDISHISGTNQVASMVVFENGMPTNNKYRRFKIRTVQEGKPDDFAAMLEVLKRRFLYLVKSKSNVSLRKGSKKDHDEIAKLAGKKKVKVEEYIKGTKDKKIAGIAKYESFDELDYFKDIHFADEKEDTHKNFIMAMIDKAKRSRVYVSVPKAEIKEYETSGFQIVKKTPNEIKLQRGKACLLFNKSKYKEEKGFAKKPDLVVIDGGKGQLTQGIKVEKEFDVDIPLVALAKKHEDVFVPGSKGPLPFEKNSEGLYLLQQVRDEAHRFALAYHRKLRGKEMIES